jgi:hypothetical protein
MHSPWQSLLQGWAANLTDVLAPACTEHFGTCHEGIAVADHHPDRSSCRHERRVRARVAQAERQRKEQAKARKAAALAAGGSW